MLFPTSCCSAFFKTLFKLFKLLLLLFDAKLTKEKLEGGITETLKWELLNNYKGNRDWLLAGGLNHNNILEALI